MDENCRLRQGEGYGVCCDAGIGPYRCKARFQVCSKNVSAVSPSQAAVPPALPEGEPRARHGRAGAVKIWKSKPRGGRE